jgi:adenylate kinase family enzyme
MEDQTLGPDQFASANRIHIVGAPGTGKSTLARRLGATLGLPVHELDAIAYEGPDFHEQPLVQREAAAREIASDPRWVAEGIFIGWTDPLLERADLIIWLDYLTWRGSAARAVARTFRGALREMRFRRGSERFLRVADYGRNAVSLIQVLHMTREYWGPKDDKRRYPVTRESTAEELKIHAAKVLHVTCADDARDLLELFKRPTRER